MGSLRSRAIVPQKPGSIATCDQVIGAGTLLLNRVRHRAKDRAVVTSAEKIGTRTRDWDSQSRARVVRKDETSRIADFAGTEIASDILHLRHAIREWNADPSSAREMKTISNCRRA
jgi:hypothetical protein